METLSIKCKVVGREKISFCQLALLLFIFLCNVSNAQEILWERSYGGMHAEYMLDMQPTADYGFILAGASLSVQSGNKASGNNGDLDYYIWKMNEKGDHEWQKTVGGPGQDLLYSIKSTKDGGFILAGTSKSGIGFDKKDPCLGKEDIWIVKLNAKGEEQWQITLGGPYQDLVKAIDETTDGGFIVGGSSASPVSLKLMNMQNDPLGKDSGSKGGLDYWIIRLDNKGKILWQRDIGGEYADILESLVLTADGGCIAGGYSNSTISEDKAQDSYGEGDYWIVKLDKDGNLEWERTYGGDEDDHLYCLLQLKDNGYLLGGSSASGASGIKDIQNLRGTDYWVIRIDERGEILWQKTFDIGMTDIMTSMIYDSQDAILIGGYAQSEVIGKANKKDKKGIDDYVALKITTEGEELWREVVGSSGEDHLRKVIETRDGAFILGGTSKGEVSRNRNSGHGLEDFWVVKLMDQDNKNNNKARLMIEAIPNPTSHFTNVILGFDYSTGVATLFDISGRMLQSIPITGRTIPVDLEPYPVGMYIVEVITDKGTESVKIVRSDK